MFWVLRFLARHGRFVLVAGLIAGLLLPNTAITLRPFLGEMVLVLLFLTAFRVGLSEAQKSSYKISFTVITVFVFQLILPVVCIATCAIFGWAQSPIAIALTVMLSAPSITGSPNLAVMLGHSPEAPFSLLILGTFMLPITIIPVFWLSPGLGGLPDALATALRLCLMILGTVGAAFYLRATLKPKMVANELLALDGLTAFVMAIMVVGLMSALAPVLAATPSTFVLWMSLAFSANITLQIATYLTLRTFKEHEAAAPVALVAGNRNVALFLAASNVSQIEEFLIFLGCYQFPMYLTPTIMRPILKAKPLQPASK